MLQKDELLAMYEKMVRIRYFEQTAIDYFRKGIIGGSVHPSIGQEAVAVGVCSHLNNSDYITSTHRGHGHAIAKGVDIKKILAELIGKRGGTCKGKGGSMHISDRGKGLIGSNGIVGGSIPIATGVALAINYRKEKGKIAVCFFGDGGANTGTFHESINMAAIWKLPIVFVCENNNWGISTRSSYSTSGGSIANRACAYGISGLTVDGNNVIKVFEALEEPISRARSGGGPSLVECRTYRIEGHFVGDPQVYRDKAEVEDWKKRDPIIGLKNYLYQKKIAVTQELEKIREGIAVELKKAEEYARASEFPDISVLKEDLFDL